MGSTRSNYYKNPSFAYKKDFSLSSVLENLRAYNAAIGDAPPSSSDQPGSDENPKDVPAQSQHRKRKHEEKRQQAAARADGEGEKSFSHHGYIEKIRKEIKASQFHFDPDTPHVTSDRDFESITELEGHERTSSEMLEEKRATTTLGLLNVR